MSIDLYLEIETSSNFANKVVSSLKIDIDTTSEFFNRSSLKINAENNKIILEINSKDFISAKASINTCLKWLENSIKIIEKYQNI